MAKNTHKCPNCGEDFASDKKRRAHQRYEHGTVKRGRHPTNGFSADVHEHAARKVYLV